ncbi:ATPase [Spirochaetia bacterium]|nr:ATPase [Spirochaetia bacterium]
MDADIFVDREKEFAFLDEQYKAKASSFIVLYGRRRVGKTALITRFIQKKPSLYFLATEESEAQNCAAFRAQAAEMTGNELLESSRTTDWLLIFKTLLEQKSPERLVIVFDEFQYLARANPAFPSIMQKVWDTLLAKSNVMLILCGSSVSMMESAVLAYESPLYGRRTGQIKLKQIPFSHYGEFFPGKSEDKLTELYALTGGVPKYIEFFEGGNIREQIAKNILSPQGFLYNEPAFLLYQEVSEIGSYFSLIKSIAAGNHKLADIASNLELKQTGLSKYLNTLINLEFIEREVPVTEEKPEKSKRGLYRIKDNFLQFWFRFVFPNLRYLEIGQTKIVEDHIRKNFIDSHVSFVYEDICRERMWRIDFNKLWGFTISRCGRWWDKNNEIDIVAYDGAGKNIIFGECKYTSQKMGLDVFTALEEKSRRVKRQNDARRPYFILFSKSGFTVALKALAESRNDLLLMSKEHLNG